MDVKVESLIDTFARDVKALKKQTGMDIAPLGDAIAKVMIEEGFSEAEAAQVKARFDSEVGHPDEPDTDPKTEWAYS